MGLIIPSNQASGKIPVSRIKLKKELYNGIIILEVLFMYSFMISSFPHALLFFKDLMHFKISQSVIGEFKIGSLSSSEIFIFSFCWFSESDCLFKPLKKLYNESSPILLLSCFLLSMLLIIF